MNLAKTDLPGEVVQSLRDLNIRDVETLLSVVATPTGLIAIARVLKASEDTVRKLAQALQRQFPEVEVMPAVGPHYPMGHRPPHR